MSTVKFTGEIVQDGKEFVIKTEIRFPNQDQAQDFAKWLHETIVQHVQSKGATVTRDSPLIVN